MPFTINEHERDSLAWAVQWAGHLAAWAGDCEPGGPALSHIAEATAVLERHGARVYHSGETRAAVNASLQLAAARERAA